MLPLSLLRAAKDSALLVELKSGDTYNGRLSSCDAYMNLNLTDVICTSAAGDRFWKLPACYIRGSAIKYLRLPEPCLDKAIEDDAKEQTNTSSYRGGGGGRGRGGGRDGGNVGRGGRSSGGVGQRGGGGGRYSDRGGGGRYGERGSGGGDRGGGRGGGRSGNTSQRGGSRGGGRGRANQSGRSQE